MPRGASRVSAGNRACPALRAGVRRQMRAIHPRNALRAAWSPHQAASSKTE
jgi:hypothetical protein